MSHLLNTRLVALLTFALCAAAVGEAVATPISKGGSFATGLAYFYDGSDTGTPGQWDISSPLAANTSINDANNVRKFLLNSGTATLTWTGNHLTSDNSNNGLADANFGGGGTLTLNGQIYDRSGLIYDGLLLKATVGAFHVQEKTPAGNDLDLIGGLTVTPVDGWLYTNSTLQVRGTYAMSFTMDQIQTADGVANLENFTPSLKTMTNTLMQLTLVPEPASLLLVFAAGTFVCRRGKDRVSRA